MADKMEIAWAAGFFDGEGYTGMGRSAAVSIGQVNRSNLIRFRNAVGCGSVSRPYDKGNKPISFFRAYSDEAFAIIRLLAPRLGREKIDQFLKVAIRYCFRTVRHRAGNPMCHRGHLLALVGRYKDHDCAECRRLRRSGLPMPDVLPAPIAFDLRLHGIREYVPAEFGDGHHTARSAVAWTFDVPEDVYSPEVET